MRIATWNVNSLKARLEKVSWWLERARPDVLLMQETKLSDADAPVAVFREAGYELAHHGEGRWNGVAIASRCGIEGIVTNLGEPWQPLQSRETAEGGPAGVDLPLFEGGSEETEGPRRDEGSGGAAQPPQLDGGGGFTPTPQENPLAQARMIAATCGGVRVVSLYAPNGRTVGSPFFQAKLAWYERLARWLREAADPGKPLVLGGDFNVAPEDADVWDPRLCHGGTHVSPPEREAFATLCRWGLVDAYRLHHREPGRYTWWDYRAGNFHKNFGMRIDHLLATPPLAGRIVWAEIDREARKGKPTPSDHAPLVIDVDEPGHGFDPGWASAEGRIAARRTEAR